MTSTVCTTPRPSTASVPSDASQTGESKICAPAVALHVSLQDFPRLTEAPAPGKDFPVPASQFGSTLHNFTDASWRETVSLGLT